MTLFYSRPPSSRRDLITNMESLCETSTQPTDTLATIQRVIRALDQGRLFTRVSHVPGATVTVAKKRKVKLPVSVVSEVPM